MSDIAAWLKSLALEKYAPAFEANEIDLEAARHLTEADLVEIGLPLGPRRKILAAFQRPVPPAMSPSPSAVAPAPEGERRHITVLFSDIVGSTELTGRLDPEAMSGILRAYQDAVSGELGKYGGHLAKFMGDGVLAYFGWPQASEDAAERALRAGLGIVEAVSRLVTPEGAPLRTRVGIASGLVVIGGLVGTGAAQEEAVAGDALNLAARLQSLASPNCVLVSESTHQLVGGLFECEAMGEHGLKGFPRPVPVWCVLREKPNASRFALVRGQHAGFFGREAELEILSARWQEAGAGNGYAAVLLGEAGIGKSRLVSMLRAHVGEGPHSEIIWQCSPYHSNNALYPVLQALEAAAAIRPEDSPEAKAAKLEALLGQSGIALDRAMPLFADLLCIPLGDTYQSAEGSPVQRKSALIAVLAEWIARTAENAPLLLVLEDAHWIDATTQELMTRLILAGATMPALIVVTARPSFASPWGGRPRTGQITLDRLSSDDCARVVQSVVAARSLQNDVVAAIVARSDGNPLFLEELTEAMLVSTVTGRHAIPETLQDSLMARLDAMGKAKEIAQVAAVIGRSFSLPLLARIVDADALEAAISQLVAAELIYPVGRISEATYEFKHALVRDAAYESLLLARRRVLHERIGSVLETAFAQVAENEPELLAHHFSQAGKPETAARYGERAGDRGVAQSAYAEAIASYRGALAEIARLPGGQMRDRRELALLLKLGPALGHILGAPHAEVGQAYDRAVAIARNLDDAGGLFRGIWGQWFHANMKLEAIARQLAEELVVLSERSQDEDYLLEALHCRWATAMIHGDNGVAIADSTRGLTLYDPGRHHALQLTFGGHDPGVCAYGLKGAGLCLTGYPDEGRRMAGEALALAERLGHPPSLGHALSIGLSTYITARDKPGTESWASHLIQVAEKFNFPPMLAAAKFYHAWSLADSQADIAAMQSQYPRANEIGPTPVIYATLMADRLMAAGRPAEGLSVLDELLGKLNSPGTGHHHSEIYRVRGECLAALEPDTDRALAAIQQALAIARRQGARLLELRAGTSLVGISPPEGKPIAAAALRALLASFTEGFGCDDLMNAREMLDAAGKSADRDIAG